MIYQVLLENKVIFEGNQKDICERFDAKKSMVSKCVCDGYRLHRLYTIRKKDYDIDPTLKYLIKHLITYGNTCLNKDPQPYIKDLKNNGIEVSYRKVKSDNDIGKKKTYFYIIERTN